MLGTSEELSPAAQYLLEKKAQFGGSPPTGSQPLAVASSRALEDLMSPLKLRRSHGSDASSIIGSEKSKPEDDAQFIQELEAGASTPGASWLSGVFGARNDNATKKSERRSSLGKKSIHRTKSSGSLGSLDGDDESYSQDSASSDDDRQRHDSIRRRPVSARHHGSPQVSFPPPHQAPSSDMFPIPDIFAAGGGGGGPAPAFPPDPFASGGPFEFPPDPFGASQPTMPKFNHPPSSPFGMDPNVFLRPPHLETIPSDSEDGRHRSTSSPRLSNAKSSPPLVTKHEQERASAGFGRRAPPSKPKHGVRK